MVSYALLVLGPLAILLGLVDDETGLAAVGLLWLVVGMVLIPLRKRTQARREEVAAQTGADPATVVPVGVLSTSLALGLIAGVPALVVGLVGMGADSPWRTLPIVAGGALTGLVVLSSVMYLLGSGLQKVVGESPTVPARLTVVSSSQTGTYINEMPRIEFELDVTTEGGQTYRVTKKATVPHTALGATLPGSRFDAMVVGPEDPTNMEIDWGSGAAPSARQESPAERLQALEELRAQGLVTDEEYATQRRRILDSI